MRTLILYESKTGNTQKYAEDIAAYVGADVFPLKKFRAKNYKNYDTIVFGGWVMGGNIQGLNKFLSDYDDISKKNVIVFSTGMSIPTSSGRETLINQNVLDLYHVRYYQFRGSFDMKKLSFMYRFIMNNSLRMIAKDAEATADQKMLLTIKDTPIEYYDKEKVDKVVNVIRSLDVVEVKAEDKK